MLVEQSAQRIKSLSSVGIDINSDIAKINNISTSDWKSKISTGNSQIYYDQPNHLSVRIPYNERTIRELKKIRKNRRYPADKRCSSLNDKGTLENLIQVLDSKKIEVYSALLRKYRNSVAEEVIENLKKELRLRNYSTETVKSYKSRIISFLRYIHPRHPKNITFTGTAVGEGGTILRTNTGGVTDVKEELNSILPLDFSLMQNYPNPFNTSTTIQYAVGKSGLVSLTVYDLLGRVVAVLVDGERPAGIHSVLWDASAQTSGVYFYRLQADTFIDTKKLILLR